MSENIKQTDFNKNVIQVWTEEPGFTGYKGFDFTAIDELESLIKNGLIPYTTGIKDILENKSVNVNQLDLNYLTDNVSVSGDIFYYISGIYRSLANGVNTNQLDLNALTDTVDLGGQSLNYLSGLATQGVALKGLNTVNVNVTGGSLSVLNEVEVTNAIGNPIPISNSSLDSLGRMVVTGSGIVTGLVVYQTALERNLDNVSVYVSGSLPAVTLADNQNVGVTSLPSVNVTGVSNLPAVTLADNQNIGVTGSVAVTNIDVTSLKDLLNNTLVTGENIPSGITVYQTNLDKDLDNISVYVSGQALDHLSSLVTGGIEVEIKNEQNNPVPVSGTVTANVGAVDQFALKIALDEYAVNYNDPWPIKYANTHGGDPFPISGTVTANLVGLDGNTSAPDPIQTNGAGSIRAFLTADSITQICNDDGVGFNASNPLPISGAVTSKTEKSSTISNSAPGSSNGTVLNANANRKELYIQNLSTGNLYVKYGGNANNTSFNFVLSANTVNNAGDGGSLSDQSYTGIVSVSGAVGPSYISWERS